MDALTRLRYDRLIEKAFQEATSPPSFSPERNNLYKLLAYIDALGTVTLKDDGNKREAFLSLMDKALQNSLGFQLKEIMVKTRRHEAVLCRALCWERYRKAFPLDSSRDIRNMFECPQDDSTIRSALLGLPQRLRYDSEAAKAYKEFNMTLDILIYQYSVQNENH